MPALFVLEPGAFLGTDHGLLAIRLPNRPPLRRRLEEISTAILVNAGGIAPTLMSALLRRKIPTSFLHPDGSFLGRLLCPPDRFFTRRQAQRQLHGNAPARARLGQALFQEALIARTAFLDRLATNKPHLRFLRTQVELCATWQEAQACWEQLPRALLSRHQDQLQSLFRLAFGLQLALSIQALELAGLEPRFGLLHEGPLSLARELAILVPSSEAAAIELFDQEPVFHSWNRSLVPAPETGRHLARRLSRSAKSILRARAIVLARALVAEGAPCAS